MLDNIRFILYLLYITLTLFSCYFRRVHSARLRWCCRTPALCRLTRGFTNTKPPMSALSVEALRARPASRLTWKRPVYTLPDALATGKTYILKEINLLPTRTYGCRNLPSNEAKILNLQLYSIIDYLQWFCPWGHVTYFESFALHSLKFNWHLLCHHTVQVLELPGCVWRPQLHQVSHSDCSLRGLPQVPQLPHGLQVLPQRPEPH